MNLKAYKTKFLESWVQFVVFDTKGTLVDSCDTLFSFANISPNLFADIPFLESITDLLGALKTGEKIDFPCITTEINKYTAFCDYSFYKIFYQEKACILWVLVDFTAHYTNLTTLQQQRNESVIQQELLEIEKKNAQIARDFLEYKNEELLRLQKVKSDFFTSISHEIRTPVNGILGLSELLSDGAKQINPDYIKSIHANAKHLSSIVNDVLDIAKIEANKITFESIDFDIRKLVKSVLDSFIYLGKEKGLVVSSQIDSEIPLLIRGDSVKLSQVLYNLLNNALKFTKKGTIKLNIKALKKYKDTINLQFEIIDTGIGISKNNIDKIFNAYEQAESDINRIYGGTGLGLNIVKQLLELQDGNIKVESDLGKGTKFTIFIPFMLAEDNKEILNPVSFKHQPLNILIGEDDLSTQKVLKEFMTRWGYAVDIVSDGKAVIDSLTSGKYDLLILDNRLPKLTGYEVIECIRHDFSENTNTTPIIVLTGDTSDEVTRQFVEAGVSKVLLKPVGAAALLQTINEAVLNAKKNVALINLEYVTGVADEDRLLVLEMVEIFIKTVPQQIRKLKQLLRTDDFDGAKDIVHKITPNFKYMGIDKVNSILKYLKKNIKKTQKSELIEARINELEEITKLSIELLKKEKLDLQH